MKNGLMPSHLLAAIVLAGAMAAPPSAAGETAWKPEKTVELLVGSAPGTGTDKTARMIQKIWQEEKALAIPLVVVNKPGGGGAVSWAYLNQRQGDARTLLVTSYNIVTNHITGKSHLTYTDFTPIALLISEYIAYSVKPDSPMKTIHDLDSSKTRQYLDAQYDEVKTILTDLGLAKSSAKP